jgi:hypothetical protein
MGLSLRRPAFAASDHDSEDMRFGLCILRKKWSSYQLQAATAALTAPHAGFSVERPTPFRGCGSPTGLAESRKLERPSQASPQ